VIYNAREVGKGALEMAALNLPVVAPGGLVGGHNEASLQGNRKAGVLASTATTTSSTTTTNGDLVAFTASTSEQDQEQQTPSHLIPPQSTIATPLQIIFRSLNSLGSPNAVSNTSASPYGVYSGSGEYIASGVRYGGILGRDMGLLGLMPWGVVPQTHYGTSSLSGMPVPKEGLPMVSTVGASAGASSSSTNPTKRAHNNIFYASGVRILASEGIILPQQERHPEMYESIGVEEYLEENGVMQERKETTAAESTTTNVNTVNDGVATASTNQESKTSKKKPPSATPYHTRNNRKLALPFRSKQQDILPFDFGSKGWAHTSFVYGNMNTAMSLASISKYDSEGSSGGATGSSSRSAASSGVHQRDFPDLNLIKTRMERIARMYQVEITPQCIQMMIRAMEAHIKTVLENCIRARREDELERVQRVDVDPKTFDLGGASGGDDMNSVGSPQRMENKNCGKRFATTTLDHQDDDTMKDIDEDKPSVPTQIDKLPVDEHLTSTSAISTTSASTSRHVHMACVRDSTAALDARLENDPLYGTYTKQNAQSPDMVHSYFHYKDEYEHKTLQHHQEELSQHPKVNRIISAKCLLTVLQTKPWLVAGNAEWSSRIRQKVLHSNWDLPYE